MATSLDYITYVMQQVQTTAQLDYKKMFGEYLIYANGKPALLVCDNTVFVKRLDCVAPLLANAATGFPYEGAKEHYVVDPDDSRLLSQVVAILEQNVPLPKPRKR